MKNKLLRIFNIACGSVFFAYTFNLKELLLLFLWSLSMVICAYFKED